MFKGTKHRTAEEIARQVDSIGGNMDAFTAKECVCFSVKVLDEHMPIAMDVLSDLVLNPVFTAEDIGRERGVILEEIKMDEDNPDYLVHEIFTQNFWKDHPLGQTDSGNQGNGQEIRTRAVLDFYKQRFAPGNVIICAAGHLKHEQFVELVAKHFDQMKPVKNGFHSAPAQDRSAHYHAQQEIVGAGADLRGRSLAPNRSREPARFLHIEHAAGRRHEFAAVPEHSRAPGTGLCDL